jgi:hypothetical protein
VCSRTGVPRRSPISRSAWRRGWSASWGWSEPAPRRPGLPPRRAPARRVPSPLPRSARSASPAPTSPPRSFGSGAGSRRPASWSGSSSRTTRSPCSGRAPAGPGVSGSCAARGSTAWASESMVGSRGSTRSASSPATGAAGRRSARRRSRRRFGPRTDATDAPRSLGSCPRTSAGGASAPSFETCTTSDSRRLAWLICRRSSSRQRPTATRWRAGSWIGSPTSYSR